MKKIAIIVVDPQNDFCHGGPLEVPHGDEIMPIIAKMVPSYPIRIVTQDWHPPDHCSFVENGGPWPTHCVAGTPGAALHPVLQKNEGEFTTVIRKGYDAKEEAYSAFRGTGLKGLLNELWVKDVLICGLATDYCVKATAMDANEMGFGVVVHLGACRGVDFQTTTAAVKEMGDKGIRMIWK